MQVQNNKSAGLDVMGVRINKTLKHVNTCTLYNCTCIYLTNKMLKEVKKCICIYKCICTCIFINEEYFCN
jgi:hypothetical protein